PALFQPVEPPHSPDDDPDAADTEAAAEPTKAPPPEATPATADPRGPPHAHHHRVPVPNLWGLAALGVFFLLLFHVRPFRSRVFSGAAGLGRGLQTVFIHGPAWVLHQPLLQAFLHHRFWVRFRRFVIWPSAAALTAALAAWVYEFRPATVVAVAAGHGALALLLLNSRAGRDIEETVTDVLVRFWLWLTVEFVPGLVRFIMDLSRWCLEAVEQVLYTVDEWLRFKSGEGPLSLAGKAVLSVVWFAVTYVVR